MSGEELKCVIRKSKISFSELSLRLGCTPQSLTSVFKADDVKSGTIEKIALALNVDMSFFYPSRTTIIGENDQVNNKGNMVMGDNNGAVGGDQHIGDPAQADVINKLIEQNAKLINMLVAQQNK